MCHKLTLCHVYPNSWQKMKVSFATQIFSHTCSSAIKTAHDLNFFTPSTKIKALSTANFFSKLKKLFDYLNSKEPYNKKGMLGDHHAENFVLRPKRTIKHGGGSIMVWGSFSWNGVGPLHWIKETMTQHVYIELLQDVILPYCEENMPLKWTFQQDNDPRHTSKRAKQWFQTNNVDVMDWPAQSPDLNPIENLWNDVKRDLINKNPKNKEELWKQINESWSSIPIERCQRLINSMQRRCAAVLKNRGYTYGY